MTSSHSQVRALAGALKQQAAQVGAATPSVRGADFRLAVVATVGTDGTVTTSDGITARRDETYQAPAALDTIVLESSGSGSWIARGRLASTTSPTGEWVTPALATGYTPLLGAPQYRSVLVAGQLTMQWKGGVQWTTSGTPPLAGAWLAAALPVAYRPPGQRTMPVGAGGAVVKLDATAAGQMTIVNTTAGGLTTWVSLHNVSYTLT
ncbi:hypothetical protein [Streptomyces candidus]|uniref:Uncharacterized protein n=1 Tax=Streptomyces candidus TaxID=67283 RepID=A0A7X0HNY3_9ACTN|nr:hypothetical protein [Streptomyces candidus]MBB6439909.1 hypothetical protein [Streptomyces candidus]GHH57885.1 hypothetical protein GCM10018773_65840 [Streptomyces candidus]